VSNPTHISERSEAESNSLRETPDEITLHGQTETESISVSKTPVEIIFQTRVDSETESNLASKRPDEATSHIDAYSGPEASIAKEKTENLTSHADDHSETQLITRKQSPLSTRPPLPSSAKAYISSSSDSIYLVSSASPSLALSANDRDDSTGRGKGNFSLALGLGLAIPLCLLLALLAIFRGFFKAKNEKQVSEFSGIDPDDGIEFGEQDTADDFYDDDFRILSLDGVEIAFGEKGMTLEEAIFMEVCWGSDRKRH
jgi:hypothetical protein